MAIFDDLRAQYSVWDERHKQYRFASMQFVFKLASEFTSYIGAPITYLDFRDKSTKRYIEPLQAVRDDEGNIHYKEAMTPIDAITHDKDGYWISGIKLVLDHGDKTYPKSSFHIPIRFMLRENQCELKIGTDNDGRFEFDLSDPNNFKPAFDYMVLLLNGVLELKPWSTIGKSPIGFTMPQPETGNGK